jgi:hypothetical protein
MVQKIVPTEKHQFPKPWANPNWLHHLLMNVKRFGLVNRKYYTIHTVYCTGLNLHQIAMIEVKTFVETKYDIVGAWVDVGAWVEVVGSWVVAVLLFGKLVLDIEKQNTGTD